MEGKYKPKKYQHFVINERGKERDIDAPHITDRMVQRLITTEILIPLYTPSMIYNNCASQKGKGLYMSFHLLERDLHRHYRKYGMEGHVIMLDFSQFFPTANHDVILDRHKRYITNDSIRALCDTVINTLPSEIGMPLGVEPSQAEMIAYPSALDNYLQCQLSLKGVGHYMDDYYILVPPDRDAKEILCLIDAKSQEIGLYLNLSKTRIYKIHQPFKYCKSKFQLLPSGKVIHQCNRKSYIKASKNFKKFKNKVDNGEMTYLRLYQYANSIFAYMDNYNSYTRKRKLYNLFEQTYGFIPSNYGLCKILDCKQRAGEK